ncbi:hypothetical protein Tco_0009252 [Tanacetum coccineum]
MSKSTKPHPCFYNNDYTYLMDLNTEEKYTTSITKNYAPRYYKEGIEDRIPERLRKEVRRYHFEALNGIHHWEENRIDFFKAGRSDDKEYEFSYVDLPRLSVNDVEDMLSKNKLGSDNKRLKGRDWIDSDVRSSERCRRKIDERNQAQSAA